MFPCELPAYKTVRPSSGFRIGTVFISAPRPGRTAPDGELSAIRPKAVRDSASFPQKKSRPQAALVDYFSSNEWITTPDRSLGSNHVVFGGMMLPVSAMLISCCIETG